jgi:acyl-CoA synthetase (AMP-forming)/AMP-acid ligase II
VNIAECLARAAQRHPERPALVDVDAPGGTQVRTYRQLWLRVQQLARSLADALAPGDRVALLMGNSAEYVESFLAAAAAGLVSVPLNTRLLEEELSHMLRDSGAKLLVAQEILLAGREALKRHPGLRTVIMRAADRVDAPDISLEKLYADTPIPAARAEGDLCSLMYTSGTTGPPKAVMLSHGSWLAVADAARRYLGYQQSEVTLHVAPLTHGAGFLLLPTLAAGGTNVVCARFDAARTLRIFRELRVTNGFFVPSMIRMLLDAGGPAPGGYPDLRTIYYAGSPIDAATLLGAMDRFGDVLVQSFAQMEAPMFLTVLGREDHRRIALAGGGALERSAGKTVDGAKIRIIDDAGRDVAPGEPGEIVAQAPQTMLGYWNRPDATAEAIRAGWLHTGDIGRMDAEGYLYVVDRKKDMIISGGANVYAREVEEVLLRMQGVRDAAVIGLPSRRWGETVAAVLVSEDGHPLEDERMEKHCRGSLPDYRRPKRYLWVESLPRNAYGKVLKRQLRDRFVDAASD